MHQANRMPDGSLEVPDAAWWELRLRPRPGNADAAADKLLSLSPAGLVEGPGELVVFLPDAGFARRAALGLAADGAVGLRPVRESAWGRWRRSFTTVVVSERLQVVPVYDPGDAPAVGGRTQGPAAQPGGPPLQIMIEPGLAFGTGEHPTTLGCLRYLERVVRPGGTALDVGAGSGILALAACLLGASQVVAVEIDPVACRAARSNVALNRSAAARVEIVEADAVSWLDRPGAPAAAVVTANLTSELLILLAPRLFRATLPGGWLVASGIAWDGRSGVEKALRQSGFTIAGRTVEAGWTTVLAARKGS